MRYSVTVHWTKEPKYDNQESSNKTDGEENVAEYKISGAKPHTRKKQEEKPYEILWE